MQPLAVGVRVPMGPNRAQAGGRDNPYIPKGIDCSVTLHHVLQSLTIGKGVGDA